MLDLIGYVFFVVVGVATVIGCIFLTGLVLRAAPKSSFKDVLIALFAIAVVLFMCYLTYITR